MKLLLDTTPLWLLVHPAGGSKAAALRHRLVTRVRAGDEIAVAEICDYEARRELIRRRATRQLQNLDDLVRQSLFLPIDTALMRSAAQLWAEQRDSGRPTSPDSGLEWRCDPGRGSHASRRLHGRDRERPTLGGIMQDR